jgi:biopolymer transport protein TolQ
MDAIGLSAAAIGLVQSAATEAAIGAAAATGMDFSAWGLFLRATPTVQAVMILLIVVSFWSWAIIFEKAIQFARLRRQINAFEGDFWSGQSLEDLYDRIGDRASTPAEKVFSAGMSEWNRSVSKVGGMMPGTQQRVDRAMNVAIARETEVIEKRLPFLATVGSVSPFVGLFGTVWGIKHSFESIAMQQSTNLAVVAPGIAEALFATALGLLAAIPAVVAYNRLQADAERLSGGLDNFADEFSTILGRQMDRQASGGGDD